MSPIVRRWRRNSGKMLRSKNTPGCTGARLMFSRLTAYSSCFRDLFLVLPTPSGRSVNNKTAIPILMILFEIDAVGPRRVPFKRDAPWAADVDTIAHWIPVELK